jgi:RNA polymerase sigma-70 factor (ECF subfamily)
MVWEEAIRGALASGLRDCPGARLDEAGFKSWLADRNIGAEQLGQNGGDLALAYACSNHDRNAVAWLEATHLARLRPSLALVALGEDDAQEVRQRLRLKLLVGPNPKIGLYYGHAPLTTWVRVCAAREALNLKRKPAGIGDDNVDLLERLTSFAPTPEALAVNSEHRELLRQTLQECFATLGPREKTLLRMRCLDDMSIDQIGAVFRVHRATIARWLVAVREQLQSAVYDQMSAQLETSHSEVVSLVRSLRIEIDVSLARLLGGAPAAQP